MNINSEELAPRQGFTSVFTNIITSIRNQFNGFFNTQAASESFNRTPVVPRRSHIDDLKIKKRDKSVARVHSNVGDVVIKTEHTIEDKKIKIEEDLDVQIKTEEDVDVQIKMEEDLDVQIKIEEDSYVNKEPTSAKRVVSSETSAESNQIDERPSQFTRTESMPSTSSNITQVAVSSTTSRRRSHRPYRPPGYTTIRRRNRLSLPEPYPYGPTSSEYQRVPQRVSDDTLKLILSFYNKH